MTRVRDWLRPGPVGPVELVLLAVLLAGVTAAIAVVQAVPTVLGHDEAVYATQARAWLEGGVDTGISAHRAPALPAVGVVVLLFSSAEIAFRLVGLVFGIAAVAGVWALGRMVAGPVAGLLAAAVFGFAVSVLDAAGLFLTDLPAAGLLVWAAAVCWWQFEERATVGNGLLIAAGLVSGAFYLRYGSALPIGLLGLTVVALWWPRVRRGSGAVLRAALLTGLLLLPHMVRATIELGAPWGRVLFTGEAAGRDYLGQGLVEYIEWFPRELAGIPAAPLMVAGLLWGAWRALAVVRQPHWDRGVRAAAFTLVPALGHIVVIGVVSHGDRRFVLFAVALLCVAGAAGVAAVLARVRTLRAGLASSAATVALAVLAAGAVAGAVVNTEQVADQRHAAHRTAPVMRAATAEIVARTDGSCSVLTSYVPQVTWYTGCPSYHFGSQPQPGREELLTGEDRFMLLLRKGKRQPADDVLDYYLERVEGPVASWQEHDGLLGTGELYRFP